MWRVLFLWLLLGVGCSDMGPAEPSTLRGDLAAPASSAGIAAGSRLRIVSGESGEPVSGAVVTIAGAEVVSDGAGQLTLSALAPRGATIDIRADGFLERRTIVRERETMAFELWPSTSSTGMTEDYTKALVYQSASIEEEGVLEPMDRPGLDEPQVNVLPDDAIRGDALAMEELRSAIAGMNEALGGVVTYGLGSAPSSGALVSLSVDPQNREILDENLRAFARCFRERLRITGCEVVFRSVEVVRSDTTLHELGHTFGLNHSPDRREIMGVRRIAAPERFSPREELVMQLMLKRLPGNLFPDDDRQALALRAEAVTEVVVCRHP